MKFKILVSSIAESVGNLEARIKQDIEYIEYNGYSVKDVTIVSGGGGETYITIKYQ